MTGYPVVTSGVWPNTPDLKKSGSSYKSCLCAGFMETYLMKKGRENNQFLPRKFVLSEIDNTIKYYVKDKKDPKVGPQKQ